LYKPVKNQGVMIANPSVAPFVQQACLAFEERELLHSFLSSLVADADHWFNRSASRLLGQRWKRAVKRRLLEPALHPYLRCAPFGELARLATSRIDRNGLLTDAVWEKTQKRFDRWVSQSIKKNLPAIFYGYETCCLKSFATAKKLNIPTVYEVCAIEHQTFHQLLEQQLEQFPELNTRYTQHVLEHEAERTAWRKAEWELADCIIVYSEYCKRTYTEAGYDTGKVCAIPLACPPVVEKLETRSPSAPFKVIWAGTFNIRKGAHFCLKAWRNLCSTPGFGELHVYGSQMLPRELLDGAPDSIIFHGPVSRDEVMVAYAQSDVLIFPTLSDSFGMVVSEALASGLPVITTESAGASGLIREGENGLIISSGQVEAIERALSWFRDERHQLQEMRENALRTAADWQWQDYRGSLSNHVCQVLNAG